MVRIAVFTHYFGPEIGAPSARIGDLAFEWALSGCGVDVVTCFPNHPSGKIYPGFRSESYHKERLNGYDVHRNWTYVTPNTGILRKTAGHMSFWLSSKFNTVPRLPQVSCTIGTSPTFFAAMAARDCARRQRVPFIMEVRDLWPAIFRDLGVIRNPVILAILEKWEKALYRSAARIVTVTDAFRDNLMARGVPPEKLITITNGADTDFWNPHSSSSESLKHSLGLEGKFVVLYIGAHGISQALECQLHAAARLQHIENIKFVFVGEGADKRGLESKAQELGLRNVQFHPACGRERVREYYRMADLCLVPLRAIPQFDAFIPSKMFEIMSMERPILASLTGEAAGILRRSGSASVVPPEDDEALASMIIELSSRPRLLAEMGVAGRNFVESKYSRRQLANRYLEVIRDATEGWKESGPV